ncbi:MAG: tRNA uracil 4-sulfurtransferase ThiI [Candidatus Helarchaeota archaeon]
MILIRYGEIALKTKGIRLDWENKLKNNIKNTLDLNNINYEKIEFLPTRGRFFLFTKLTKDVSDILKRISGISSFSEVIETNDDIEIITQTVLNFANQILKNEDSFALKVRRTGSHNYTSIDIARHVGENILNAFPEKKLSVNLSNPDKIIYIEIRDKHTYIFDKIIRGMGGLPVGTQGRIISLISGGIDSPVAAWMMIKRGCFIRPVYFNNAPYLSEMTVNRVKSIIKKIRSYDPRKEFYFYIVSHGPNLQHFIDNAPRTYTCLLCKRMMYRISEVIAKKEHAKGLVTGENLGQVASQTLDNINVLDKTIDLPVFRPLIGLDKEDIIQMAKKIGTYQLSIKNMESCKAVPPTPMIRGNIKKILEIEEKLNINHLINEAIKTMEKVVVL